MRAAAVVFLCLLFACTPRDEAALPPEAPEVSEGPMARDRNFDPVSVQFHVVGEVPRKPPLVELQVDVVILNHAPVSRWVLLPRQAGKRPGDGGVDVLELERHDGVPVASWLGTGGFGAVRVGPDADVRLDRYPVQWWRHDDDPQPPLEALAAREVMIDGHSLATWIDAPVRPLADHREMVVLLVDPVEISYVPWPRD